MRTCLVLLLVAGLCGTGFANEPASLRGLTLIGKAAETGVECKAGQGCSHVVRDECLGVGVGVGPGWCGQKRVPTGKSIAEMAEDFGFHPSVFGGMSR